MSTTLTPVWVGKRRDRIVPGTANDWSVGWGSHALADVGLLYCVTPNLVVATPAGWAIVTNAPQGTGSSTPSTVVHVGSAAANETNPTTTFTITLPAGTLAGHDCYVLVASRNHDAFDAYPSVADNDTGGNTWTRIASSPDRKLTLWWKKATSGTASKKITVAGTINAGTGGVSVYSGADPGAPHTNITIEQHAAGDEAHTGFTPAFAGSMICLGVVNYSSNLTIATPSTTNPGALTIRFNATSTAASRAGAAHASAVQIGGPTATGDLTWAQTDGTTYSIAWAIKPATTLGAIRQSVFWARATSGSMPPAIVSDPGGWVLSEMHVFRYCAPTGNPWSITAGNVQTPASTAIAIPGATTGDANCLVVLSLARDLTGFSAAPGIVNADLTNLVRRGDRQSTQGGALAIWTGVKATAGAYGASTGTLATAQLQARMSIALKPLVLTTPAGAFLTIADPSNPASLQRTLNVVADSFRENAPEVQGKKRRAFDNTYLSTERNPKRNFTATVSFASPTEVDDLRYFIDANPNPTLGTWVGAKPIYMMGNTGTSPEMAALRGLPYLLVMIEMGTMTAVSRDSKSQKWTVDLTFREV